MNENLNLLNNKEHRLIPYIIISLNNLFSYAGESYEKWSQECKTKEMKTILQKIGTHGKRHFKVNSQLLFSNENSSLKKDLTSIAEALIDIRNWLFHPEQNQQPKINKICRKLNINQLLFFKIIWKIIACFLYKNELVQLLNEFELIHEPNKFEEKQNYLKKKFYSVSDSFALLINNLDNYSIYCQQTINYLKDNYFSLELKEKWNKFLITNFQYSNFKFDYDYLKKELLLTDRNQNCLIIRNLECINLKKLKISKFFYNFVNNIKELNFEEFQAIDSGFITKKYKRLIKEIYKVLKIYKEFEKNKVILIEYLSQRNLLNDNALKFLQKIDLFEIRNQTFHFSYKEEKEQEIYSEFFYLIAHLENKKEKDLKIEEDLSTKINQYLD